MVDVDYDETTRKQLEAKSRRDHPHGTQPGEDAIGSPEGHVRMMVALKNAYGSALHSPRSLYASSYDFLEDKDLEDLNSKQVLTQYLKKAKDHPGLSPGTTEAAGPSRRRDGAIQGVLRGGCLGRRDHRDSSTALLHQAPKDNSNTDNEAVRVQMLVVPQLWLWKIDRSK